MHPFKLVGRLYDWLETLKFSYTQVLSVCATAIFLRTFAENFTNSNNGGTLNGFIDTFFHYPLWFGCIFLSAILIFTILGRVPVVTARTIVALASFGILIPPFIDIFWGGFANQSYNFLFGSLGTMFYHYVTLMLFTESTSVGLKIEILLALVTVGVSVLYRTRSLLRGLLASFLLYTAVFICGALPMIGMGMHHAFTPGYEVLTEDSAAEFYLGTDPVLSVLWQRPVLSDQRDSAGVLGSSQLDHFSLSMTSLLVPLFILLLALIYRHAEPIKFKAILGNLRYTRLLLYLLLASFGAYLGFSWQGSVPGSLGDVLALLMLAGAVLFSCFYLIWENDEEDIGIDTVSNTKRPLVAGHFTPREWKEIKWTFLVLALVCATLAGWYVFIFILFFLITYHAYSCPPLRLKRVPGLASLIIALNALITVMAGFFLTSGTESLRAFPVSVAVGILIVFLLAEQIKNMKDIKGDRAEGILTLPVLLGDKYGPHAVAIFGAGAILAVPLLFGLSLYTLLLAVVTIPLMYYFIVRTPYKELPVFLVFLCYFVLFFICTLMGLV